MKKSSLGGVGGGVWCLLGGGLWVGFGCGGGLLGVVGFVGGWSCGFLERGVGFLGFCLFWRGGRGGDISTEGPSQTLVAGAFLKDVEAGHAASLRPLTSTFPSPFGQPPRARTASKWRGCSGSCQTSSFKRQTDCQQKASNWRRSHTVRTEQG